jgi:hypothetical protein
MGSLFMHQLMLEAISKAVRVGFTPPSASPAAGRPADFADNTFFLLKHPRYKDCGYMRCCADHADHPHDLRSISIYMKTLYAVQFKKNVYQNTYFPVIISGE